MFNLTSILGLALLGTVSLAHPGIAATQPAGQAASQYATSDQQPSVENILSALFAPAFPTAQIQHQDIAPGLKLLHIRGASRISNADLRRYKETLLKRGLSINGAHIEGPFTRERVALDSSITLTRPTGVPGVIEVSTSVPRSGENGHLLAPLAFNIDEIAIPYESSLGKKWTTLRVIPEKEPKRPETLAGPYPGSYTRLAEDASSGSEQELLVSSVARANLADVARYYEWKLRTVRRVVNVPENIPGVVGLIEIFGIKTSGYQIVISGYNYDNNRLRFSDVTLKQAIDPNLAEYVEIEIREN